MSVGILHLTLESLLQLEARTFPETTRYRDVLPTHGPLCAKIRYSNPRMSSGVRPSRFANAVFTN